MNLRVLLSVSLVVLLSLGSLSASAKRQRTMQQRLTPADTAATVGEKESSAIDTVTADPGSYVRLSGYDKPLTASKETMHVTNLATKPIAGLTLSISYLDMQDRQLHRVTRSVKCDIPAGETRIIEFPSWDRQKSFYYRHSAKPRRQATPYDITITVDSILLSQ